MWKWGNFHISTFPHFHISTFFPDVQVEKPVRVLCSRLGEVIFGGNYSFFAVRERISAKKQKKTALISFNLNSVQAFLLWYKMCEKHSSSSSFFSISINVLNMVVLYIHRQLYFNVCTKCSWCYSDAKFLHTSVHIWAISFPNFYSPKLIFWLMSLSFFSVCCFVIFFQINFKIWTECSFGIVRSQISAALQYNLINS